MSTDPRALQWFRDHAEGFSGPLSFDEPLSRHTYYRIGGPAAVFAAPKSAADVAWLARAIQATGIRRFVLGAGSNLLVSDDGFPGLIIRANRMQLDIGLLGPGVLRTGGGVAISSLLRKASQEGWGGLELLTGIPGSVGGAVVMNAGTHLGEVKNRVLRVEAYDLDSSDTATLGAPRVYEGAALSFEYRRNRFLTPGALVWAVDWHVELEEPAAVKARIDETLARRKSTQPIEYPSCGSVFKNPRDAGLRAWEVVEKLGLRGHQIGGAQISQKHPNFIVNLGGARAADVLALIQLVKSRADSELGIAMEEEVIHLF